MSAACSFPLAGFAGFTNATIHRKAMPTYGRLRTGDDVGLRPTPRKGALPPSPQGFKSLEASFCFDSCNLNRRGGHYRALSGCSIALAALPLATAVSLPRCGSLCRFAASAHRAHASLRAFRLTPTVRFALRASAHRAHANLRPPFGATPQAPREFLGAEPHY